MKKIKVEVLSAFALAGVIKIPGTAKAPSEVVVDEKLAKNLLRRGKVKLAEGASFGDEGDDEDDDAPKARKAKKPAAAAAD
jgi:hypothetical protein